MARTKELDMLNGALLPKLMMFSLPLALTGILQLLFNAADVIVVGKFAGSTSLAAVGATSALINLLTGAFIGISVGVNILVARYIGCRDDAGVSRAVHSAVTLSLLLGVVTFLLGFFLSTPMLELMGTPDDVLRLASLYLRIYFIGIPGALIYNFAAAILRAYGDTKRPLLFLAVSGVLNVFLNLFFVIVCRLDVAGVAIATVVSQYVSVVLILVCLMRQTGPARLSLRQLRLHPSEALRMIQIGLPAGLQSVVFNISNVMVQSCVNSFGADVIAANTASANIAAFTYTAMNAVFHAAITFTSQNLGARRRDRNGHDPHILCHDPLFPLRHHGGLLRHGARARKIVAADGRDDLRRLRDADRLDLHHFRVEAYASRPLCLLPHQLGHHRGHACRLLRLFLEAYPPEARADRTRGSGYQKGVLIFLYASH